MTPVGRHFSVILMSFGVILVSAAATLAVWSILDAVDTLSRDVVSLLSWVLTFYVGTYFMWRGVVRLSRAP